MKNKGFTLIELLAVIAILAIILLIAVPMAMTTVANARLNSAKTSAKMAFKAADAYQAEYTAANNGAIKPTVSFADFNSKMANGSTVTAGSFDYNAAGVITAVTGLTVITQSVTYTCTGITIATLNCV